MHNDYEYGCKRKGLCDSGHFEYSHRAFFVIIISLWLGVVVFCGFFLIKEALRTVFCLFVCVSACKYRLF